jgi:peptidoglycan/LPS O-acetylase OafA/YrhL
MLIFFGSGGLEAKTEFRREARATYLYFLDSLRAISAIVILIWHYQHFYFDGVGQSSQFNRSQQPLYNVFGFIYENGFWAVQMFWIVSGYVFCHVYSNRAKDLKEFASARFARLYPLHLITLLTVAAIQIISKTATGSYQIVQFNDWWHFFLNLFFISGWGFQDGASFNEPIWSVSVEIAIYGIFYLFQKHIFRLGIFIPLVLCGFGTTIANRGTPLWFFGLCAMFFFLGALIFWFVDCFENYPQILILASAASTTFFIIQANREDFKSIPFHNVEGFLFVPFVIFVGILDLRSGRDRKLLKNFGQITYSTYLWHFPIQVLFLSLFSFFGFSRSFLDSPIALICWILLMVAIGLMSYKFVERPLQQFTLKFLKIH